MTRSIRFRPRSTRDATWRTEAPRRFSDFLAPTSETAAQQKSPIVATPRIDYLAVHRTPVETPERVAPASTSPARSSLQQFDEGAWLHFWFRGSSSSPTIAGTTYKHERLWGSAIYQVLITTWNERKYDELINFPRYTFARFSFVLPSNVESLIFFSNARHSQRWRI